MAWTIRWMKCCRTVGCWKSSQPRDLIDVFAASRRWSNVELEEFGRRHARGRFEREDLQANPTGAEWTDDEASAAYGLGSATITTLRAWALQRADDLAARLLAESDTADSDEESAPSTCRGERRSSGQTQARGRAPPAGGRLFSVSHPVGARVAPGRHRRGARR
ncbi:hypothetical protein GCM10017776_61680 [Streptomyces griseoluteus]|nr:hypothetical protein [Streptomyces griseoluteus]GHF34915.1 hypothetical protein GCM10017776_61680 [Streptomyces griseoluteus]